MDCLYTEDAAEHRRTSDLSALDDFFATTAPASGNRPTDKLIAGAADNIARVMDTIKGTAVALARGDSIGSKINERAYAAALRDGGMLRANPPQEAPHTHTVFYANGPDLPTAARVMADNYSRLLFHSDDPEVAVAGALGVPDLGNLDLLWNEAMAQPTPLAAGQLVLRSLNQ
jgi:hypothetical protein